MTLDNCDLVRRLGQIQDELQVEQAKLAADAIRFRQESQKRAAEHFQLWAILQRYREDHARMQRDLERVRKLKDPTVISGQERDRITFAESAQRGLVDKLAGAVDELRKRSDNWQNSEEQLVELQLQPTRARIGYLNGDRQRTSDEIRDGELRSPVTGIVVRRHAAVGQRVTRSDTLVEVVDQSSLRVELFVPQKDVRNISAGMQFNVSIESLSHPVSCTVLGPRHRFEEAPESIRRYYSTNETLMPLVLRPHCDKADEPLHVGAVTRLSLLETFKWR